MNENWKVDLKAYVDTHDFLLDYILDEHVWKN